MATPTGGSGPVVAFRDGVTSHGQPAATQARLAWPVLAFATLGAWSCDRIGADGHHCEISKSPALDLLDHRVGRRSKVRLSGW